MKTSIHLTFAGQCEEAFRFYENCGIGEITLLLKYGDSPAAANTPAEWHEKIIHANLQIGEGMLAGADDLAYEPPRGFYVLLGLNDTAEAERIFADLAHGGIVKMPMQETFWAPRFGVLIDRFGVPWEINCSALND